PRRRGPPRRAQVRAGRRLAGRRRPDRHAELPRRDAEGADHVTENHASGGRPETQDGTGTVLRPHAEQEYADELARLAEHDDRPRPPGWRLSPWAVTTYLMGG